MLIPEAWAPKYQGIVLSLDNIHTYCDWKLEMIEHAIPISCQL